MLLNRCIANLVKYDQGNNVLLDFSNYLHELVINLLVQSFFFFEGSDIKLRRLSELVSPGKFIFLFSDVSEPEI